MTNSTDLLSGLSREDKEHLVEIYAEKARRHLLDYCSFVDRSYLIANHLELMAAELEAVERGDLKKLMFFIPPRHGKSELTSVNFPQWVLGRNPDLKIINAAYAADLSTTFSRRVRNEIEDKLFQIVFPSVRTSEDSRDVSNWTLHGHKGGMLAAGVGGAITGFGADVFIIDDPFKNQQEADSELIRERVYDWYKSVVRTRLEPNAAIILIMTRWHQKDLAGRILENESDWKVVSLPALAEENDPIGRKPGEALWPERYNERALLELKNDVGTRNWNSLFQGRPMDPESAIIKREWIQWYSEVPIGANRFAGIDTATSQKTTADNMSMVDVCKDKDGFLYCDDVFLEKISVFGFAKHVSAQHAAKKYTKIKIEDNNAGEAVRQRAVEVGREDGTNPPLTAEHTSTDKVVRVNEFAPMIENGTLKFKRGSRKVADLVEHLIMFDGRGSAIDDDVDALGLAVKAAKGGKMPNIRVI